MGLNFIVSSSSFDKCECKKNNDRPIGGFSNSTFCQTYQSKQLPNPKPDNYTILVDRHYQGKNDSYLLLIVIYHDCENYEGKKILVFKNCELEQLKIQKLIDPHFSDNKTMISPIARFEPNDEGIENAIFFCKMKTLL